MHTQRLSNETYDLPLPQIWRRSLVILEHLSIALPAAIAVSGVVYTPGILSVYILMLLLGASCHIRLAMSIQNIAQVNPLRLDERQRATRDRAFVLTLHVLAWSLTLAWVYALIAGLTGWWLPPRERIGFVLWGFGMLAYSLPTALAAWLEPDPIIED
jgi:hypothetical protein